MQMTMATFRTHNPKPPLFNLLHYWNLHPEEINRLKYYKLKSVLAPNLARLLAAGRGTIGLILPNSHGVPINFVPIYHNITRQQIKSDSPSQLYWLSFRLTPSGDAVVLIQRDNSQSH